MLPQRQILIHEGRGVAVLGKVCPVLDHRGGHSKVVRVSGAKKVEEVECVVSVDGA